MKKRVTLKSENSGESKLVLISESELNLQDLLKIASKKLRIKAKALLLDGEVLTDDTLDGLRDEVQIVVSNVASSSAPGASVASEGHSSDGNDGIWGSSVANQESDQAQCGEDSEPCASEDRSDMMVDELSHDTERRIRVIANRSMVEPDAIKQLKMAVQQFSCIRTATGMPDLHPGPQFPIGAAFGADRHVLPFLVGNDVGCGMTLFRTNLKDVGEKKSKKWVDCLESMEGPWDGDSQAWLEEAGVSPTQFDTDSLGTVGGGNHFAELQAIEEIVDENAFNELELDCNRLCLLVHSGSRGYGNWILKQHLDQHGTQPLQQGTTAFDSYMSEHDNACMWAKCNRKLIAHRFLTALEADTSLVENHVLDICHNNAVLMEKCDEDGTPLWLHRKGAAPADCGPVVVPGSRGAYSYLVLPVNDASARIRSGHSLPHGAGRRWTRGRALSMGRTRYKNPKLLHRTDLNSHVICDDSTLLYEEHPDAYKDIGDIIDDLETEELVTVVAVLRPVITFKNKIPERHKQREPWRAERKRASRRDEMNY